MATVTLNFTGAEAFAAVAAQLYKRSGAGRTESGAFLLGQIEGEERTVRKVVYFDDIDPGAYHDRAIKFDTTRIGMLYDICESEGLSIVGDVHVHPAEAFLSPIDAANPVVAVAGHVGIILPYSGRYQAPEQIAVHILDATGGWHSIPPQRVPSFLGIDVTLPSHSSFNRTELLLLNRNIPAQRRAELLNKCAVQIIADRDACETASGQAALLTAVALSTRFARGGVYVHLPRDARVSIQPSVALSSKLRELGATLGVRATSATILVGENANTQGSFSVGVFSENGTFGCKPAYSRLADPYVPGVVAAAALAVSEVFRTLIMQKVEVHARSRSLQLWTAAERHRIPAELRDLIGEIWLAGFGHLGNAYSWVMALTPGLRPRVRVTDNQTVDLANASTQLFVRPADVGRKKVDVAHDELKSLGFNVERDDQPIESGAKRATSPRVILSGFDNTLARRALAGTKADLIVDSGLGSAASTFSSFSVHSIFDPTAVIDIFGDDGYEPRAETVIHSEAYEELRRTHDDRIACGLYGVAAAAVAVPFVGCTVAAIALSQIIRAKLNMELAPVLSGDVLSPNVISA